MVKAGDKLLLLGALGALRTLEFNTQILLEPLNRLGNAVDKRLDELGVGNAAADGLDGVDEVLFVIFVDGPDEAEAPGTREEARSAHGLAGARHGDGCARACRLDGGAEARNARSNYQYISRFHRIPFSSGALSHERSPKAPKRFRYSVKGRYRRWTSRTLGRSTPSLIELRWNTDCFGSYRG